MRPLPAVSALCQEGSDCSSWKSKAVGPLREMGSTVRIVCHDLSLSVAAFPFTEQLSVAGDHRLRVLFPLSLLSRRCLEQRGLDCQSDLTPRFARVYGFRVIDVGGELPGGPMDFEEIRGVQGLRLMRTGICARVLVTSCDLALQTFDARN